VTTPEPRRTGVSVTAITAAVGDLDAAIERLERAQATPASAPDDEQRRALDETLTCLFRIRDVRKGKGAARTNSYIAAADGCSAGQTTEGLVVARNTRLHELTHAIAPGSKGLFPGLNTFPGRHTFPGFALTWLRTSEMDPTIATALQAKPTYRYYDAAVAGLPVLQTVQTARAFLTNPSPLGPL
jgi:hypothetical protein